MRDLSNDALLAERIGHREIGVGQTAQGGWFAYCSCGWVSTISVRLVNAAGAGAHHLTSQVKRVRSDALANGITLEKAIDRYLANPPTFRNSGARAASAS